MKEKRVIDRTCVIITTSAKNQNEVIDKLTSLKGKVSINPYNDNNSFEKGHKIIFIYGYSDINNMEGFSFCITQSVARNEVPCGELSQENIDKYFKVKTETGREKLLSRENKDIYAPIPTSFGF